MTGDVAGAGDSEVIDADVCIVGGGTAGLILARTLSPEGAKVVVLERGGRKVDRRAHLLNVIDDAGHPIGRPHRQRRFALGGAGRMWSGVSLELSPLDLSERLWVEHCGWPLGHDELRPFYRRARSLLGVPEVVPDAEAASERLELLPVHRSRVRFGSGTEIGANTLIRLDANAVRLATGPDRRRVASVDAVMRSGARVSVRARTVVLAAGGIEVPRLLLLSEIGNQHDLVGRFFADHPYLTIPVSLPPGSQPPESITWAHHTRPPCNYLITPARVRRREGLLGAAVFFRPYRDPNVWESPGVRAWLDLAWGLRFRETPFDSPGVYRRAMRGIPALARAMADRRRRPGRWALRVVVEPAPNPESRVALSTELDALGLPLPRVEWRLGSAERSALERFLTDVQGWADREGWGPLAFPEGIGWPERVEGGAHHMGTTRMHPDPRRGVVDADGRVHGTDNLYVAGPSVFPTYGYANPMLTIVALTLRLGEHLRRVLGER